MTDNNTTIRCHYDVLNVEPTADAAAIKKAHRKLALKLHPDKNANKTADEQQQVAEQFRRVQQAYECLSDPQERAWYDDHRHAILAGWNGHGGGDNDGDDLGSAFLFNVVPYTFAGCFSGFEDDDDTDDQNFFAVYQKVFSEILKGEQLGATNNKEQQSSLDYLAAVQFGNSNTPWPDVAAFYQAWESFSTSLNFAWEDLYDARNNDDGNTNRRIRRAMEDENKRARKQAKKRRNDEILALTRFVKKRDPRVQQQRQKMQLEQEEAKLQQERAKQEARQSKQKAREDWKVQAAQNMAEQEEEDRRQGRIRLADMDDDYDYGGGGKKKGKRGKRKGKGKKNKQQYYDDDDEDNDQVTNDLEINNNDTENGETGNASVEGQDDNAPQQDAGEEGLEPDLADEELENNNDDKDTTELQNNNANADEMDPAGLDDQLDAEEWSSSEEEEEEPDVWRCEVCRKDFKSKAQLENHVKSKKHKENYKKHLKKLEQENKVMDEFLMS